MEFDESDVLINERKAVHERFHTSCKKEKRNTTEGKVKWIKGEKNRVLCQKHEKIVIVTKEIRGNRK